MISILTTFAAACTGGGNFLGFPTWYEYLDGNNGTTGVCSPKITSISDVWLIVAAVIEILLRIAALAAVGYIIYGGTQYLSSQGEPDKTTKARQTLINAVVGLVVAILAAVVVNFVAGSVN